MIKLRMYFLCAAVGLLIVSLNGCQSSNTEKTTQSDASSATKEVEKAPQVEAVSTETASRTVEDGGTGPYTAVMVTDSTLTTHTIFRPKNLSVFGKNNKLPIFAWGNGACANSPSGHINFLSEIASHGFLVVAIGPMPQAGQGGGMMGGGGTGTRGGQRGGAMGGGSTSSSTSSQLIDAINWAIAQDSNETSIYYNKIDTTKIAVSGMSCGGLQALEVGPDERITTLVICNSGIFTAGAPGGGRGGMRGGMGGGTGGDSTTGYGGMPGGMGAGGGMMGGMILPPVSKDDLKKLHSPIIYILGGNSDTAYDMAYVNGTDDFRLIDHIPAFVASYPSVGHGGTYMQPHGGEFAKVAVAWLKWQLKGDKEAGKMFTGNPCGLAQDKNWTVEKKNIP